MNTTNSRFENAEIGEGCRIDEDVTLGYRFHADCGPARIGKQCVLHKGTVIYGDVIIGDYFLGSHYIVVRARVRMGDYCALGNHSTIEGIVRLGTGVRVMSHTYIPSRTWVGDHVFIGPGVTFLNDKYPYRRDSAPAPQGATLEDDVMVGGGATVLAGVTIGERSFIGAGALVNRDIPPRSLVVGVPGRISPLPTKLDVANTRAYTTGRHGMWDARTEYPGNSDWPDDWPEAFSQNKI